MARQLTLTNKQFEVLYDILADTVEYIEDDLITTEDENGNEVLEDITEYEAYQIYQQIVSLKEVQSWILKIYKCSKIASCLQ